MIKPNQELGTELGSARTLHRDGWKTEPLSRREFGLKRMISRQDVERLVRKEIDPLVWWLVRAMEVATNR